MKSKNFKNIILSASILGALSFSNIAFADQVTNTELKQQNTTRVNAITTNQDINTQSNNIKPAVNVESNKNQKNDHIIPVLELKGGVKEAQPENPSLLKTWLEGDYATGNWYGLRSKLEDRGISINSSYFNADWINLRGGKKSSSHLRALGVIDTNVGLDTEKLGLWSGGKLFTRFQNKHGLGSTQDFIGDYQLLEAYDTHRFGQVSEYWYEQSIFNERFKIKVGKQDANYDFCALNSGFNFANSSFSYMPNVPLPSFPDPAMGLTLTVKPTSWSSVKSAWFDGEGLGGETGFKSLDTRRKSLFLEEVGITPNFKNHPGNYFVGYWLHTGHTDEYTTAAEPRTFGQNTGWYLGAEQLVFKENKDPEDTQGLTMLGQFGWSPADRNELSRYWGLGVQYQGLVPKRDNDIIGFASANAGFSGRLKELPDDGRHGAENVLEMFYKVQLTPWLAVQPDMQVIMHPNGQEKSSFAMGLRTLITF